MANNDISQRIVLTGEKEYSSAIKEAQRNLKTLRSELKAETAELGKNATAQQKNEVKAKSLKAQIAEQEKVVKACKDALDEVKDKYADNEDAIAKYEQKLNDARTALANMNNQLEESEELYDTVESGASSAAVENYALAESFENIASVASTVSETIEGVFTGIISKVKDTVSAIWGEVLEIAGKADNYLDLAEFLGASATDVQKWSNALNYSGNSMTTITSLISKMKYGGTAKKVTEWFGISDENYTNDLEYIQAVIQQMYDYKDSMKDAGTWDTAMSEIFGAKKVQEVDGILSDWEHILDLMNTADVENGGVGLTEDQIEMMGTLQEKVNKLQMSWDLFKDSVTTELFGKLSLELTSNAQGALDALIQLMDAKTDKEREDAITKFKENVTEAFKKIGEAIQSAAEALNEVGTELQGSENGYVKLLGDILVGISDAMEWLTDEGNTQKILNFFNTLIEIWAAGKALDAIGNIGRFITSATNLWSLFGGNANANPATDGTGTMPVVTNNNGTETTGGNSGRLGNLLNTMVNGMAVASVWQEYDKISHQFDAEMEGLSLEEKQRKAWAQTLGMTEDQYDNFIKDSETGTSGGHSFEVAESPAFTEAMKEAAEAFWDEWRSTGEITDEMEAAYEAAFSGNEDLMDKMDELMMELVSSYVDDGWRGLEDLPSDWWKNQVNTDETNTINSLPGAIGTAIQNNMSGIKVVMDGETVGYLVAPYVSQEIAKSIY